MDDIVKKELVETVASRIHEVRCDGELKAFYKRLAEALSAGVSVKDALERACLKGGKKRNEYWLDSAMTSLREVEFETGLQSFESFKKLVKKGFIEVKRFTSRILTNEEIKKAGINYKAETKEENILRPFGLLSNDSKKENIMGAISAVSVLEIYLKRGYTLEQLGSEELKDEIGTLIHADWMKRNKVNSNNEYLFVSYSKLDDWTKQQDLDIFKTLLNVVEKNPEKYAVSKEDGLSPINAEVYEQKVLSSKQNDNLGIHN